MLRKFGRFLVFLVIPLECFSVAPSAAETQILSSQGTNRATAYAMQNKIVSLQTPSGERTFIVYSEVGESTAPWMGMSAWVAEYDPVQRVTLKRTRLGAQFDNHGTASIAADSQGYLHVAYGPHYHPFRYRRSLRPFDSSEWTPEEAISVERGSVDPEGEYARTLTPGEWSYPILKVDDRDILHIAGSTGGGVAYVRRSISGWEPARVLFLSKKQYSRYDVMMNLDADQRVHILAPDLQYEVRSDGLQRGDLDYHHFVSHDSGDHFEYGSQPWSKDDGYAEGIGNVSFDANNSPHFLTLEMDYERRSKLWLVKQDKGTWKKMPFEVPGRHIWQAKLVFDHLHRGLIVAQANDSVSSWRGNGNSLYLFRAKNLDSFGSWSMERLTSPEGDQTDWLPSLEEDRFAGASFLKRILLWTREGVESDPNHHGLFKTNVMIRDIETLP